MIFFNVYFLEAKKEEVEKNKLIFRITKKMLGPVFKLSGGDFCPVDESFNTCMQWAESETSYDTTLKYPIINLPNYTGPLCMSSLVKGHFFCFYFS
jgi:hypothetical protein